MQAKALDVLTLAYVASVLDAAVELVPDYVNEELAAAGFQRQTVSMAEDGETRIGVCLLGKKILRFHGPIVLQTPIGRLPGQVALLVAEAYLWLRKDPWSHDERRIKRWACEWGFAVDEQTEGT